MVGAVVVRGGEIVGSGWHRQVGGPHAEVEALRALTYRACDLHVQGEDVTQLASMAKLKTGRLTREVSDTCLQFWGGMGFTWENRVSRLFRDGRLGSIGGGADEVMLGILAKTMGIAKRPPREPDVRSAGLAVSRSAVRKQGVKHTGPEGLRG